MKKYINDRIRKGFHKYIEPTLSYFKITEMSTIEVSVANDIIKFINSSNTKLSESYYILRGIHNYNDRLEKYKTDFIESSYNKTNRRRVGTDFNNVNMSRGYSGYVRLDDNCNVYCRSSHEFVYYNYLYEKYKNEYNLKFEAEIFYFDKYSYKPDVFLYNKNGTLEFIFEIKSGEFQMTDKYKNAIKFFNSKNIKFEILTDSISILKNDRILSKKLDQWKAGTRLVSMKGSANPMYGRKQSEDTKNKISRKTKNWHKKKDTDQYKNWRLKLTETTQSQSHRQRMSEIAVKRNQDPDYINSRKKRNDKIAEIRKKFFDLHIEIKNFASYFTDNLLLTEYVKVFESLDFKTPPWKYRGKKFFVSKTKKNKSEVDKIDKLKHDQKIQNLKRGAKKRCDDPNYIQKLSDMKTKQWESDEYREYVQSQMKNFYKNKKMSNDN